MKNLRAVLIGAGVAILTSVGLVGAMAAIPGPGGVINACYKTQGGDVKIIDSNASCPNGYTPINWNQTGPAGPAGPQGPAGPDPFAGRETVNRNWHDIEPLDERRVLEVFCPEGKKALNGGWGYASSTAEPPAYHPKIVVDHTGLYSHQVQIWTGDMPANDGLYMSLFVECVNA